MKVRKTGKSGTVKLTFGEQGADRKISKISNLKTRDSDARKITKGLYGGGHYPEDVKNILVKIKGGYSKGYSKELSKKGIKSDEYYGFAYYGKQGTQWTAKEILKHVENSMENFSELEPTKKAGSGPTNAKPRISQIEISYVYH